MAGLRPRPGQGGAPAAPGPPPRACRRSGCPGRPGARGPPGRSPQRCRSAAGTATQHRAGTVTMPAGVTARDRHTGAGGQRQPVTGPPFQDAGDHLPGHPAGGVDPAHPVDRIRGHARRVGQRQGTASARTPGRAAGRAGGRRDDRGMSWSVTAASPERGSGTRPPGVPAGRCPQACSSGIWFGEKSPVLVSEGDLNTQAGDCSPEW